MISSGMKRSLAVTAVSALAVTGLPFLAGSANAVPLAERYAPTESELFTASNMTVPAVGVRNDGVNQTVHLVSTGGSSVAQMRYSYTFATVTTTIATVSRSNGVFSAEWAPPSNTYGIPNGVEITAQPLGNAGQEIGTAQTQIVTVDANATTIDIANAPGSSVGIFEAPYTGHTGDWGILSGTTSDVTNPVTLQDQGDGLNDAMAADIYGDPAGGVRTFKGVANFDTSVGHYPWDTTDPKLDQAVVQGMAGTDDNETVNVYKQTITTVTAAATNANPPASNPDTDVVVTVLDQSGKAIAGAEVVQDPTGTPVTKYTDANGKATFPVTGDADGNTFTYLVNVDDEDGYQSAKDFQRNVTVTTYNDAASAITPNASALGNALDFGEYAADPVTITVTDQNGAPKNNENVLYSWSVAPFAGGASQAAGSGNVTTGTNGKATIPAPTGGVPGTYTLTTYIERDGNPGKTAGDLSGAPLNVKMGNAEIVWADDEVAQAPAGSSKTFNGTLELEDGTGLAGREVTMDYAPGDEYAPDGAGDSFVSTSQPAGTTRINNNSAMDTTDSNGGISVSLTDPSETPQPREMYADLYAQTTGTAADAGAESVDLEVDWLTDLVPAVGQTGTHEYKLDGYATPGRPVRVSIHLRNADGTNLTDQNVTVTTDHGFFTTPAPTTPWTSSSRPRPRLRAPTTASGRTAARPTTSPPMTMAGP